MKIAVCMFLVATFLTICSAEFAKNLERGRRFELYNVWIKYHPEYNEMTYREFVILQKENRLPR